MIIDTVGIALKHTLFNDDDIIVRVLTKKMGVVSFFVRGGRKKNKKKYLQPLMLISISFKHKKNKDLQYLNKIRLEEVPSDILVNHEKRTTALFLCEIISRCLKHGVQDDGAYDFVYKQVVWLNLKSSSCNHFDIWFLANFTKLLGISPNYQETKTSSVGYFCCESGSFNTEKNPKSWNKEASFLLYQLLQVKADQLKNFSLNNNLSKFVLSEIINFYSLHLDDLKLNHCLGVYNSLRL